MSKKMLGWIERTGDRMGDLSDLVASAMGTYLRQWLRFFWYGVIALLAGALLDDPFRITGIVLGVVFVADFSIAIMTEFVDYKEALVWVYVWVWWPFRNQVPSSPVGSGELPTSSRADARAVLMELVK